jgi:hypothetical protein
VIVGWRRGRFAGPVLQWYCHPHYIEQPAPLKEVDAKRRASALKAAATRRKNKEVEHRALADARRNELNAMMDKHSVRAELRPILSRARNYWATTAIEQLLDINAAHPQWLADLLYSVEQSDDLGGIMYLWRRDDSGINELDFYQAARRAMSACARHENTDYDQIDKRKMSDDDVEWLRQEKTAEGRKNH